MDAMKTLFRIYDAKVLFDICVEQGVLVGSHMLIDTSNEYIERGISESEVVSFTDASNKVIKERNILSAIDLMKENGDSIILWGFGNGVDFYYDLSISRFFSVVRGEYITLPLVFWTDFFRGKGLESVDVYIDKLKKQGNYHG